LLDEESGASKRRGGLRLKYSRIADEMGDRNFSMILNNWVEMMAEEILHERKIQVANCPPLHRRATKPSPLPPALSGRRK
jgi:hypothetical protein